MEKTTILNDYIFKQVFGRQENEKILISFLNAMLDGDYKIKRAKVITPEMPRINEMARTVLLDTQVQTDDGTYIDIEVQQGYRQDLIDRMLIYGAKMLSEHSEKATMFDSIKCISIWILNCSMPEFDIFKQDPIIGQFCFRSTLNGSTYLPLQGLTIYPIELKKGTNIKNISTFKETWINFLRSSTGVSKPEEIEEVHDAYDKMLKVAGSPEYRAYKNALDKAEQLKKNDIAWAREDGIAEGEHQKAIDTAKKLLKKNLSIEDIAECTGLTTKEVKSLVKNSD